MPTNIQPRSSLHATLGRKRQRITLQYQQLSAFVHAKVSHCSGYMC